MKRTKQLEYIIKRANDYFDMCGITDESDDLFWFLTRVLSEMDCYKGYNMFLRKKLPDGKPYLALAGSKHRDDYDCLQIM